VPDPHILTCAGPGALGLLVSFYVRPLYGIDAGLINPFPAAGATPSRRGQGYFAAFSISSLNCFASAAVRYRSFCIRSIDAVTFAE
jgi:hypothetical protein